MAALSDASRQLISTSVLAGRQENRATRLRNRASVNEKSQKKQKCQRWGRRLGMDMYGTRKRTGVLVGQLAIAEERRTVVLDNEI